MEFRLEDQFPDALFDADKNERWTQINDAAEFIVARLKANQFADLMFVCTHNSRRSQFAHVWAEAWARSSGLEKVRCYSGGTEVTECNERTVAALRRIGFEVHSSGIENPIYKCTYSDKHPPVRCNSSLYTAAELTDFAAMMCCSDVDEKCPIVEGAAVRIPFHYDDPKSSDGTADEESRYDERCRQIGRDMKLMMTTAANRLSDDLHRPRDTRT